ncbi:MAG TPA: accessory factor UbiK family protein [Sphingomonadales bacterium]|nr:accessory factor UbiK family protein [Sphingomonadales bacterium]
MQTDHPLIDDLSKLAQGLMSTLDSMKKECDAMVRARVERLAAEFELVPRDDFEALRALVLKLRAENEDLKARLGKLEKGARPAAGK